MKFHTLAVIMLLSPFATAMAQSGTNSPYSQFGLGMLSDQSTGFNRGMNGVGVAFHEHNQVNSLNPASYSALDSLSFIFDVGLSGQISKFKENGVSKNAKNADFEYVVAGFRAFKHFGVSFGLLPFTTLGYSYSSSETLNDSRGTVSYNSFDGSGGLHEIYLGLGWSPFKGFSIGVNGAYLYGSMNRSIINSYSISSANTISKYYTADVRSYKLDFGAQYSFNVSKKDAVSLGAVYTPGHKIGGKPTLTMITSDTQSGVADTTSYPGAGSPSLKFEIPTSLSVGLAYLHSNKLKVGVDYSLQKWADVDEPAYSLENGTPSYALRSGLFKDRHKVSAGLEYTPNQSSRHFVNRVRYRAGVSYATPYYYINGQDGPKELSASIGFGIPIMNSWNNRSILNISGQWVRQSAKNFITDNTFRINIGLTFNERWFAKWKVE